MHFLAFGAHSFPPLTFGTARIWDMGVTWRDLQPSASSSLSSPSSNPVLARLDQIVATFRSRGVDPVLTLGMTPAWAARNCQHRRYGTDWGTQTCAPAGDVSSDANPWARYVSALARRYAGKIRYYETWNEPSLANGYNDAPATLATMQAKADSIVHRYGAQLVSPGVPFTNGPPSVGLSWLDSFLTLPGGSSFDVVGVHLYPSDAAARAGDGPEWSVQTVLPELRRVLARHGADHRPLWNTETNVGRAVAHTGYKDSPAGAGAVARTFVLALQNQVARTMWYAADERQWGGTWLENASFSGLTPAGLAYQTAVKLLVGLVPRGCTAPAAGRRGAYICRFESGTGAPSVLVGWTTGSSTPMVTPRGATEVITATGAVSPASSGGSIHLSSGPTYVRGAF